MRNAGTHPCRCSRKMKGRRSQSFGQKTVSTVCPSARSSLPFRSASPQFGQTQSGMGLVGGSATRVGVAMWPPCLAPMVLRGGGIGNRRAEWPADFGAPGSTGEPAPEALSRCGRWWGNWWKVPERIPGKRNYLWKKVSYSVFKSTICPRFKQGIQRSFVQPTFTYDADPSLQCRAAY